MKFGKNMQLKKKPRHNTDASRIFGLLKKILLLFFFKIEILQKKEKEFICSWNPRFLREKLGRLKQ